MIANKGKHSQGLDAIVNRWMSANVPYENIETEHMFRKYNQDYVEPDGSADLGKWKIVAEYKCNNHNRNKAIKQLRRGYEVYSQTHDRIALFYVHSMPLVWERIPLDYILNKEYKK